MLMENPIRWMDLGSLIEFDHSAVLEWTHSVEMALAVMVLHHFPSPSPSCGLVKPINLHRLQPIAWEPQTPACHQIKWISNSVKAPRLGRAGWRAGRLSPLLHLSWLFCLLFGVSLSISNCVPLHLSRPTSLSPPPRSSGLTLSKWN